MMRKGNVGAEDAEYIERWKRQERVRAAREVHWSRYWRNAHPDIFLGKQEMGGRSESGAVGDSHGQP